MSRKRLRIHSEAQREIADAFDRYFAANREVAARFLDEIESSIKKVVADPSLYPIFGKKARRRVLARFPYSVIFQDKGDVILVVAVAHAKRRPGYWAKRLNQ
jgi:toxin ParE1/3/4